MLEVLMSKRWPWTRTGVLQHQFLVLNAFVAVVLSVGLGSHNRCKFNYFFWNGYPGSGFGTWNFAVLISSFGPGCFTGNCYFAYCWSWQVANTSCYELLCVNFVSFFVSSDQVLVGPLCKPGPGWESSCFEHSRFLGQTGNEEVQ